ncbi:rifampicin phosphotransferase-like [Saccoglossus kowalevskii]
MRVASWTVIPQRTVRILQLAVSANSSNERKVLTVENTIAQLKNTTPVVRYILKRLIPKARKAMKNWKETRSLGLKAYHMIKQAYWQLAECMVKEGYLPERDLIFFLTHQEIGCVLHRTNPKLVTRAARRRKVYPNLFELRFDDISIGKPKPLKDPGPVPLSLEMKGLPMCKRKVSGRARVARTLEEADSIKVGDVLVVRSPDIAWVPYYAIISGLVTEIGGLLSHGAMIAQEYDIPCVVNVKEATTKFESGDYIMIDGHTGIVRKLQTDF